MRNTNEFAAMSIAAVAALSGGSAWAQSVVAIPAPPAYAAVDANGVDLVGGGFATSVPEVAIGPAGDGGLTYSRNLFSTYSRHSLIGTIEVSGSKYTVSFGGYSEVFNKSGSTYTPERDTGATLVTDPSGYLYTARDGTKAWFKTLSTPLRVSPYTSVSAIVVDKTLAPTGLTTQWTYRTLVVCQGLSNCVDYNRLQGVSTNQGYAIKFDYVANASGTVADRLTVQSVYAINLAYDTCDLLSDTCAATATSGQRVTYNSPDSSYGAPTTATDALNRVTTYVFTSGKLTGIRRPSSPSANNITISYDGSGRVQTVTNGTVATTYAYSVSGTDMTVTASTPLSRVRTVVTDTSTSLVKSDTDALGRPLTFLYDSNRRLTRVTNATGAYTNYTYGPRGNVTEVKQVSKTPNTPADIVTTAEYPTTCTNIYTCNKPSKVTDPLNNVTDFEYDPTHGGVTSVKYPAPAVGGTRPQTRYAYSAYTAYYKNAAGTLTAAGTSVYKLASVSACAQGAGPSCSSSAQERQTVIGYGATGVANNLLPVSVTQKAADNSVSATTTTTFDKVGNVLTVDGPLSGTGDTTRYRYDSMRQLVGMVAPDPDGGGSLKPVAVRLSYNVDGQVTAKEFGTVTSQADGDWSTFAASRQVNSGYDAMGRTVTEAIVSGGTTYGMRQYSYDTASRPDCAAIRMNQATYGSLPSSACSLAATAGDGSFDRISQNTYNAADQVTKVTEGLGTSGLRGTQVTAQEAVYLAGTGQLDQIKDAGGRTTQYEYDGFGRVKKVIYPSTSSIGQTNSSDYEEFSYDAASHVVGIRMRNGVSATFTYDALGRVTGKSIGTPPSADVTNYTYDNFGQVLTMVRGTQTITYTYDALGRRKTETGPLGQVSSEYDSAGRRTKITWPGSSFYVNYDYDNTGKLTAVRENGATSGAGLLVSVSYDSLGRRTGMAYGNGVSASYGYDAISRLNSLGLNPAGTAQDQTVTFAYNNAGQITGRTSTNEGYTRTTPSKTDRSYSIDGLNRVTSVTNYQTSGNSTSSMVYGGGQALTSDGTTAFGYDDENRLTSGNGATLAYDPAGRLFQVSKSSTSKFLYDGSDIIAEYDGSGNLLRRFVHGTGIDQPLVWYEGSGTSDRRSLFADERGSIVAVANSSGTASINTYNEYGVPGAGNQGRFQYTGQVWLSEVGVYHYKARAYSPSLGRFLQPDPAGYSAGMNLYAYVGGDPINMTDPAGLKELCLPGPDEVAVVCADKPSSGGGLGGGGGGGGGSGGGGGRQITDSIGVADTTLDEVIVTAQVLPIPGFLPPPAMSGAPSIPNNATLEGLIDNTLEIIVEAQKPRVLWHYTTYERMIAIQVSMKLKASLFENRPSDVRYGDGVYLTDVPPGTLDGRQLSFLLVNSANRQNYYTHFVSIDVRGLNVIQAPDRPHIFLIPTREDLNITGRLIGTGSNGGR